AAVAEARRMDASRAQALLAILARPPLISVVMPVYNVDKQWLLAAVASVRNQFYPHWELCIADDASNRRETLDALDELDRIGDKRIRIARARKNGGIAVASNRALKAARGDYVALLDNDDEITRDALLEMALRIDSDSPDLLYSDEDKL